MKQAGVVHNSKSIKTVVVNFLFWYGKHIRDTTVLIDLLWLNVVNYSSTFFLIYYSPYSSWKFLVYLFVNIFLKTVLLLYDHDYNSYLKGELLAGLCSLPCL